MWIQEVSPGGGAVSTGASGRFRGEISKDGSTITYTLSYSGLEGTVEAHIHFALEESDLIRTRYPLLHDTCQVIADPLVRNLATLGGNLAHGDPANDHPATMLALGAEVVAAGPKGERRIPITSFFTGPFATALKPDEILVEIRVPIPPARSGGAYLKLERKVGDFATVAVAAQLTLGASGACDQVRLGLPRVLPPSIHATRAEAALKGNRPDDAAIKRAAQLCAEAAQPSEDLRGSVEYKRDMVRVLTARARPQALERAGEGRGGRS